MAEQIISITELDPNSIEVGPRLRPVSDAGVAAVKASIIELGTMKDAIHVRKKTGDSVVLLAGLHRLTAVKELGWDMIPVVAWRCNDDWARLMEIDDNLAGAELTPLDTAVFLAERKAVYERLHPETKAGVAGATSRWDATDIMSVASFAAASAEKFGMSERHVRRMIAAGSGLGQDDIALLRSSDRHVSLSDLQTLAKVEPKLRFGICKSLSEGKAKNASDALRQINAQPGDKIRSASDQQLRKINDAFARAGQAAKRGFVADNADALRALLAEHDAAAGEVVTFVRAAE